MLLSSDNTRVWLAPEHGGRLAQIAVRFGPTWAPLLIDPPGAPADADPHGWGSFVMAPWPNRVARGRFTFEGREVRLPVNEEGHALHGLAATVPWVVDEADETSCTLSVAFDARWPFGGRAVQRIAVFDGGLTQVVELHAGDAPYPAGCGWHPWFRRDALGSPARVLVDANDRLERREMIPTGTLLPVEGEYDLRGCPPVGSRRLDECYAGADDVRIAWGTLELTMSTPASTYVQVYAPEHAVCLEPQTCAPDSFNLDPHGAAGRTLASWGTRIVAPGKPMIAATTWRWGQQSGP